MSEPTKEPFYLLVAGSRDYDNYDELRAELDYMLQNLFAQNIPVEIVSGGARGADALAERYATERGLHKHIFPAEWNKYGRRAGYIRNTAMHRYIAGENSDRHRACICFWDERFKGTAQNFSLAEVYHNPIVIYSTVRHMEIKEK